MRSRRSLLTVAVVATVALAAALALAFSKSGHHRTGTNGVALVGREFREAVGPIRRDPVRRRGVEHARAALA